jgi:circadian clock protein KaiC
MTTRPAVEGIAKLPTGIPGLDLISLGGLPKGRTTLVAGTAGSAKTVMAVQFLAEGIKNRDESGVFVTFEENPDDIRNNMISLGWDIRQWEAEGRWAFVDASLHPEHDEIVSGSFDFGALLARVEHAIAKVTASRVAMDSLGAVFTQYQDRSIVRRELFRLSSALKKIGVTAFLTSERTNESGKIARYGVEEFVADNVILLRNMLEAEKRRRTIEILKFRGTVHQKGEYPFTIIPQQGVVVIPLSAMELKQKSSSLRITSGQEELDRMCGGGFFRDSIILVSGATGTGKTLMATQFLHAGAASGERCLIFGFEESREQLFRNAGGWGVDFEDMEKKGLLQVICDYPEIMGLEDHLLRIKQHLDDFNPHRVVVDSLSALERVSTMKGFREFVVGLTSFIKHQEVAGLFTSTTPNLMGGTSITEAHISTITDSIILLRYVEIFGEMRRGLTVLKMRGSAHEKTIREFTIDGTGMHIENPFQDVSGILSGYPSCGTLAEMEKINSLLRETPDN